MPRRRKRTRKPRHRANKAAVANLETIILTTLTEIAAKAPTPPQIDPADTFAVQGYLDEYRDISVKVDTALDELAEALNKATCLESLILDNARHRLHMHRLPDPAFTGNAVAALADLARAIAAGGMPLPFARMEGAADKLRLQIDGTF